MTLYKNLTEALKNYQQVTALRLKIKDPILPMELMAFPRLEELYLDAPLIIELPQDMSGLQQLRVLELQAPKLKVISALFELPHLEILRTHSTPLYPLRLSLGAIRSPLKFLTLRHAELKELPLEIGDFSTVQELNLSHNALTTLPPSFKDLKNLKRLNLDQNHFSKFPEILTQMPQLKFVSLDHNHFSVQEKERIQNVHHLTIL
jgi:leucine-rich repeat protein SHOC2